MAQAADRGSLRPAVKRAHVIGGGLAGLSAALHLTEAGFAVRVYEAGPAAGGRCRSYFDKTLGVRIDNGNHLLLSGNLDAMAYLDRIGARETMVGPGRALFPFMDLSTGERWTVEPGVGRVPWWVLSRSRRVPGTGLLEYLSLLRLRRPGTVAEALGGGPLYHKLLEPLAISGLNTMPEEASAALMWAVVEGSLLAGGAACVPLVPREGLSESFIDPAIAWLLARGGEVVTGHRVSGLAIENFSVRALGGPGGSVSLAAGDVVVLAVPAWVAAGLLPGLPVPDAFEAILNVHFRVEADAGAAGFVGLIGGLSEWVFVKPGIVSVTISAANRYQALEPDAVAEKCWAEVGAVLGLSGAMPPVRVVRERRATFAATASNEAKRPASGYLANLSLAGDWTATGLPATIEGAIKSGRTAVQHFRAG